MKKTVVFFTVLLMLFATFCTAYADGIANPLEDQNIKIHIAETFSDRSDGIINWDDSSAGFWNGSTFFSWPDAQWKDGQLVFNNFKKLKGSRMTFRIQTKEMAVANISGSVGIGFYIENNTKSEQNVGFYMVGASSCLRNKVGSTVIFIDTYGNITKSTATADSMAVIPAESKGYVISYYDAFENLWSSDPYNPDYDAIRMPGFELINLVVDGQNNESVVIDNIFYFGNNCKENNTNGLINRVFEKPTVEPTVEPTTQPTQSQEPTQEPSEVEQDDSLVIYIISGALLLSSIVAAAFIAKK